MSKKRIQRLITNAKTRGILVRERVVLKERKTSLSYNKWTRATRCLVLVVFIHNDELTLNAKNWDGRRLH